MVVGVLICHSVSSGLYFFSDSFKEVISPDGSGNSSRAWCFSQHSADSCLGYFDFPATLCLLENVVNCLLVYFYEYVLYIETFTRE